MRMNLVFAADLLGFCSSWNPRTNFLLLPFDGRGFLWGLMRCVLL